MKDILDAIREVYSFSKILEVYGLYVNPSKKFISYAIMTDDVIDPIIEIMVPLNDLQKQYLEKSGSVFGGWSEIGPFLPGVHHRLVKWGTSRVKELTVEERLYFLQELAKVAKNDAETILSASENPIMCADFSEGKITYKCGQTPEFNPEDPSFGNCMILHNELFGIDTKKEGE